MRACSPDPGRKRTPPVSSRQGLRAGLCALALLVQGGGVAGAREDAPPAPATATPTPDPLAEHEQDLGRIETRMAELEQELLAREERRDALYVELEQTERDVAALARAGRQLSAMVAEQRAVVADLERRLDTVREELRQARAGLAELLRSAHAMGRGDRLRMILNQEDTARAGRLFGYYRCVGRERSRRVALVDQQAKRMQGLNRAAETEAERLTRLARRQEETRARLAAAQQARAAILAGLEQAIQSGRDQVSTLRADAAALRALIEDLRRHVEIRDELDVQQDGLASRQGQLDWPLADTRLLTPYRTQTNDLHGDGVLLAAAPGSEVRAVHHGQVVFADWLRGFGLLLIIDHDDGYMTLYGHNQSLLKEPGEWVSAGDVIALAGASGGSIDAGLYFALRLRGEPLDPERWCKPLGSD